MAAAVAGKFVSALGTLRGTTGRLNLGSTQSCALLQARNYAARKGTRERARKKKVKVVVEKIGFIPHKDRGVKNAIVPLNQVRIDDSWKQDPPSDDVWIGRFYKWKVYSFEEAIKHAKDVHSLEMLGAPNALVQALVELDMLGPRPSRPVTKFARIVTAPHNFDHGETRTIAAFCKTAEMRDAAEKAGATIVGGPELVSSIQTGDIPVTSFDYAVAHPDMMAELLVIKGLLKRKYPNPANGCLGADIPEIVNKFRNGIKYQGSPHIRQPMYGTAEAQFGRLDMETKQLEENFTAVINDMMAHRPKRPGAFITRIRLTSPPSGDLYKIDHELYTGYNKHDAAADADGDDDEDDEQEVTAAAAP